MEAEVSSTKRMKTFALRTGWRRPTDLFENTRKPRSSRGFLSFKIAELDGCMSVLVGKLLR
jgi:hypothetical protein